MTYEYVCTACAHEWEAEQPISAPPLKTCPKCHAETAKRQVSGGMGFILKGGGWYSDGYAPKPASKTTKPSSASATPSKSNGVSKETKSETPKTETKPDTSSPAGTKTGTH